MPRKFHRTRLVSTRRLSRWFSRALPVEPAGRSVTNSGTIGDVHEYTPNL